MHPSLFQSFFHSNPPLPTDISHYSSAKKRIPPFHPIIDDQTGPGQLSKKLKTSKQPSELFADVAENLFSHYSNLGNMKKTCFPFQIQFPQILEDNDLFSQTLTQSQSQSQSSCSTQSLLFSSQNSSLQNSAQKSSRRQNRINEEDAETASKGRSFASSGASSDNNRLKKHSKQVFRIIKEDKCGFVIKRKLEFCASSNNESPLKKSGKTSESKSGVSQKQDELKNRLEDILKQAQSLLDNMKETANQISPKKEPMHVKYEILSQDTHFSEREIKIELKVEEEQQSFQQIAPPPQIICEEFANKEETKRNPEIRLGEAYQANINNILNEKKNKQVGAKLLWNPDKFNEEELMEYQKAIKKILKMEVISEEKALQLLKMKQGNIEDALREIKENYKYYMSNLKVNMRSLRSSGEPK